MTTGAARGRGADDDLTLQQAADLLGVHYMTAYRYVRTGRIDATQVDNKWRVSRRSLDRVSEPVEAGRAARGSARSRRHYEQKLCDRLIEGDEAESWRVTQKALASACSAEDLYLDVLGPALRRVGDEWAAGRLTVADEHRATATMYRLVGRLGPLLTRRGRTRGFIVLGAPAGDYHALATALVADVLRGRGFAIADLGANTPAESFVETVSTATRLVGIGVVVSAPIDDPVIAAALAAITTATDAPLLLGGVTIRDAEHAHSLGADAWTNSARGAVDWFDHFASVRR